MKSTFQLTGIKGHVYRLMTTKRWHYHVKEGREMLVSGTADSWAEAFKLATVRVSEARNRWMISHRLI